MAGAIATILMFLNFGIFSEKVEKDMNKMRQQNEIIIRQIKKNKS